MAAPARFCGGLLVAVALAGCASQPPAGAPDRQDPATGGINVPVEYYRLDNGLKVVLSRDASAPTVTVGTYYRIGFRIEPRGRTGFAHLFEHLMFQGSGNLGKMEFIRLVEGNGGVVNGSTRFDFTNYFQIVPAHALETVLWAEADRMKALAITQENLVNQQGVVKNEVRDNVLNQPYGGFPWLTLPQVANENWYNAHNFYGDLADLDAVTLEDARAFFEPYYAPNNAVLVVEGDFDPAERRTYHVLEKVAGLGVPVACHTGQLGAAPLRGKYGDPIHLDDVIQDFPNLTITAGHMAFGWHEQLFNLAGLKYNIMTDVSAWQDVAKFNFRKFCTVLRGALDRLGKDRVLFGTDNPFVSALMSTKEYADLIKGLPQNAPEGITFTEDEVNAILGENAARIYAPKKTPKKRAFLNSYKYLANTSIL